MLWYVENQIRAEAKDFLEKLLIRDPKQRLGAEKGVAELKEHPFLADVNWQTLITDLAPWVPLGKEADTSNFPNAREDDLDRIIEEETKENYHAVKEANMTMRFKDKPIIDANDPGFVSPKTMTKDENIVAIQHTFNKFEGVNSKALEAINEREATKELKRVNRALKKMKERG